MYEDDDIILLDLPIAPVPASRPRVTKWGAYYGKRYTQFKNEAADLIPAMYSGLPLTGPLRALITFYCKRAKTTKREYPRGDVDNYAKAILDSANGKLYVDDDQIIQLTVTKQYAINEEPMISIYLEPWILEG
tara:strand:- start:940 stop:1338 length:399 start_codon:yes stop_codon:yes gene_type:complete